MFAAMFRTLLSALTVATIALPASAGSILAIFAHPDDELTVAPMLARYAREGNEVHIAYATSGDQGPGVSSLPKGAELAKVREGEARCSANALGLTSINFAGYGDGTLGAATDPPGQLLAALTQKMGALINSVRPDVIVTWGPDGGYGHPDHRLVSAVVTSAVQATGEGAPRLVYPGIPTMDPAALPPEFQRWAMTDPARLNITVPYEDADFQAARAAFLCHETQFDAQYRQTAPLFLHGVIWRGAIRLRDWSGGEPSADVLPEN